MRRLTLMLVGTMSMMGAGVFALACSSDPPVVPGDDDGDDDQSSSGNKSSSGTSGNSGSGGSTSGGGSTSSGGSGGTCFQTALRPSDKGPYCPFLPRSGSSGTGGNCETGQTCCSGRNTGTAGSFDPASCVADIADCPEPTNPDPTKKDVHAYECLENNDCVGGGTTGDAGADGGGTGGGQICCYIKFPVNGTDLTQGLNDFTCNTVQGEFGTRCRAATACESGELQACQADSDCGAGKTCKIAVSGPGGRIHGGVCN